MQAAVVTAVAVVAANWIPIIQERLRTLKRGCFGCGCRKPQQQCPRLRQEKGNGLRLPFRGEVEENPGGLSPSVVVVVVEREPVYFVC